MDATEESWRDEVIQKLAEVFKDNVEDFARTLFFLEKEDEGYKDNVNRPYAPQWNSLKATLKIDEAFRAYAKMLSEETKKAEIDQEFRRRMNIVHEQMMSYCDDTVAISKYQKFDFKRLFNHRASIPSVFGGLARALSIVPPESKLAIMSCCQEMVGRGAVMSLVEDAANLAGGTVVMVGLAAVYLAYSAYSNIRRWWKGEITGKRCLKNVLDSTFTVGAGIGGSVGGAALGSLVGPIGTVVGGIVGGLISSAAMSALADRLTQKLFGIPKEEGLENAYRYLRVKMTASNAEVNSAFRKLCLQHHPDKGGDQKEFHILQCNMAIIKQARGEF